MTKNEKIHYIRKSAIRLAGIGAHWYAGLFMNLLIIQTFKYSLYNRRSATAKRKQTLALTISVTDQK